MTDEAPVIRWVNNLFYTAVRERASDIHIEPHDDKVVVRYRIDGRLVPRKEANRGFLPSIVSRVKIEAGLNIAEKRLPQDGRITKKIAGKVVDVRVSTIPTAKGERVVMRLLDKEQVLLDLRDLGFARAQLEKIDSLVRRPNGIVLVTGPTGSGKTTTLYGCLNKINTPDKNILTAEDPVEYELKGIGQLQVQPKIGLTFASSLRSFLRQDPDVIMVGEIRDHETADIAIHASLTGHLVLSTLHTNDAPASITRLIDMGIQAYQISSSLLAVLAQRLVRRLCRHCRVPYRPTAADFLELGLDTANLDATVRELQAVAATTVIGNEEVGATMRRAEHAGDLTFYRPLEQGCEECSHTGYRGRVGIFELMIVDEAVRREIVAGSDSKTIQRAARKQGMLLLREDGARQVIAGVTSVDEVIAATQAGEVE
jgi:general secretion pathway protein E